MVQEENSRVRSEQKIGAAGSTAGGT